MTKEGLTQRIRLGTPDKRLLVVTAHVWTLISKIVSYISQYLKPKVTTFIQVILRQVLTIPLESQITHHIGLCPTFLWLKTIWGGGGSAQNDASSQNNIGQYMLSFVWMVTGNL